MAHAVIFAGHSRIAYSTKPAGAYIVANIFRQLGLTAVVIDHFAFIKDVSMTHLINKFVDTDTRFVCFSTTLSGPVGSISATMEQLDDVIRPIFNECKERAPQAKTLVGGSKISAGSVSALPFDFAVKGQGEACLAAIINHVLHGDEIVTTELNDTKYVDDTVYGYGDFNSSTLLRMTADDAVVAGETLPLEFGRGCVFKCSYCSYQLTGKEFSDFTRPKELLAADFRHNKDKHGVMRYSLTDDTINDSIQKAQVWYDAVKSVNFDVEFGGYMRLELFQRYPEMADMYLESGLRAAIFGIETFNKTAGSAVGKGFGDKAKPVLQMLRDKWKDRVHIHCNFIIGLPHDTVDDIYAQQEWLEMAGVADKISLLPLHIVRGDSSILSKEYETYYSEIGPDQWPIDSMWVKHFEKQVNWRSPIMTFMEAHTLATQLKERWERKYSSVANQLGGFQILSLLQYYTLDQLKAIDKLNLPVLAKRKVSDYYSVLEQVEPVAQPLPPQRIGPQIIPHSNVFVPKINKRTIKVHPKQ